MDRVSAVQVSFWKALKPEQQLTDENNKTVQIKRKVRFDLEVEYSYHHFFFNRLYCNWRFYTAQGFFQQLGLAKGKPRTIVLTQRLQKRGPALTTDMASQNVTVLLLGPQPGQAVQTVPIEIIRGGKMFNGSTPATIPQDEETGQFVENDYGLWRMRQSSISHLQHCLQSCSFDEAINGSYEIISCCLGPCQHFCHCIPSVVQDQLTLLGADNGKHSKIILIFYIVCLVFLEDANS